MKKAKAKYRIYFSQYKFYETWAVSEKQAINNVKHQLGYAGTYEYHEHQPIKIEIVNIYEPKKN